MPSLGDNILSKPNVRVIAARTLAAILKEQGSLLSLLASAQQKVAPEDVGLLKALCFGVMRHFRELEFIAAQKLKKPIRSKDKDVYALILLGIYQLKHSNVPEHAAIAETAGAAKKLKKNWAVGFVNAILRELQRSPVSAPNEDKVPAYYHNHPDWFVERLRIDWPDSYHEILSANNSRAPMTLRVNQAKTDRSDYLDKLQTNDLAASAGEFSTEAIYLAQPNDVYELPNWDDGFVSVQDEAAQLSAQLLNAQPGEQILDACAAPGGKTCHILESAPTALVTAIELEEKRTARIHENLARLGLEAKVCIADASKPDDWWDGTPFDRILLDAPCSATGVIRRHPDIRFLRNEEAVTKLAQLQASILEALWPTLKSGGVLVYATCSVLKQENEETIASFLAKVDDAKEIIIEAPWGQKATYGRQLFPQVDGHDGFYYCLLQKH